MPRKFKRLPRQTIQIDKRGRTTIPAYLLEASGIERDGWIVVEAYPNLEECKGLLVRKG